MLLWTTPSKFLDAHLLLVSFQDPTGTWQPPFPVPSLFLSPTSQRTHRDKFSRELAFALCMFFTPAHSGLGDGAQHIVGKSGGFHSHYHRSTVYV